MLHGTSFLSYEGKKIEVLKQFFTITAETGNVKFWIFDLIDGIVVTGPAYRDGNTFYLRGSGRFLPIKEEDKKQFGTALVPWASEMMVTVVDQDTVKWKLNYVRIQGAEVPWPGVGTEVTTKRVE